jgi:hypothetical protein
MSHDEYKVSYRSYGQVINFLLACNCWISILGICGFNDPIQYLNQNYEYLQNYIDNHNNYLGKEYHVELSDEFRKYLNCIIEFKEYLKNNSMRQFCNEVFKNGLVDHLSNKYTGNVLFWIQSLDFSNKKLLFIKLIEMFSHLIYYKISNT